MAHPAKMLPSIPRYLIATYTEPGDHVWDPMAGIASTVVEAMWLGRHGIGIEYEPHWVDLAAANIRLATEQGAPGTGRIIHGDARDLPELVPAHLHGRVALVITSPPYGPATHGHVRTPGARRGKVRKVHHRYGQDPGNLAYQHPDDLAEGFTQILHGVARVLRPGGILAVTARPYHDRDELVDIPGMIAAAGLRAGLQLHEDAAALIGGIRNGRLIPRGSFFQQRNIRAAIERGDPQFLGQSEDVVLFSAKPTSRRACGALPPPAATAALNEHPASPSSGTDPGADHGLDPFTRHDMDRYARPAHPRGRTRSHPGQEHERTPDPCLPYPPPTRSVAPPATGPRPPTGHTATHPQPGSPDPAGRP